MKSRNIGISAAVVIVFLIVAFASAYVVDETEQVVVTQFGRVIGTAKQEPGLYFKIPIVQNANYFPKNLLHWDGDPGQVPTMEKTYIWIDTFARWKIVDPVMFFQTTNNTTNALGRLDDIIDAAVRNFITSYRLIETVRSSNRQLDTMEIGLEDIQKEDSNVYVVSTGREKITQGILQQAKPKLEAFGIELVDVKLKRLNYIEQVRKSVYGRMIAERNQIAEKFRSEGKGEAQKIRGEKERDLKQITSEAYKIAEELKGTADAEATRIYASAYNADPEFYSFVKTLETYKDSLGKESSIVMSTDSEFFKYFKGYSEPSTPATASR